ncbi:MAG TPA: hypothetical protein VF699_11330 [Caulobacteraceae bacterium]
MDDRAERLREHSENIIKAGMGSRNTGRSVPLAHYFEHAGCGLLLICLRCEQSRRFELPEIIARLEGRRIRADLLGIQDVARYVRGPCPRCGGTKFASRPAWR